MGNLPATSTLLVRKLWPTWTLKGHASPIGPGQDDSYADLRSDYQKNEVAVDYNAGFTGQPFLDLLDTVCKFGLQILCLLLMSNKK